MFETLAANVAKFVKSTVRALGNATQRQPAVSAGAWLALLLIW